MAGDLPGPVPCPGRIDAEGSGILFQILPASDLVLSADQASNGLRVGDVLLGEDAGGEGVGIVAVEDRNGPLQDDDAVIELFVDKVDGAAGNLDAVIEGLLLRVETGKSGQQRGMDIEDALGKGGDELGREQAHVTGETDEIDAVAKQQSRDIGIVRFSRAPFGDLQRCRKSKLGGGGDAGSIGNVGDDDGDFDARQLTGPDGVGDGKEV